MSYVEYGKELHYNSVKDLADAVRTSIRLVDDVFDDSKQGSEDGSTLLHSQYSVYRCLNPETDLHLCRNVATVSNIPSQLLVAQMETSTKFKYSQRDPNATALIVQQFYWKPFCNDDNDLIATIFQRVVDGPKPFIFEGLKYSMSQGISVQDNDICPFHNERALGKMPKWKDCCKSEYLHRANKAKRTKNDVLGSTMYEPLTETEAQIIYKKHQEGGIEIPLTDYLRIGYFDYGVVRLKVPKQQVSKLTEVLHDATNLHSILQDSWLYIGYCPLIPSMIGLITFGDLKIFPSTGIFEGTALTARRLTAIIVEMKNACKYSNISILDATIEMQPSHKMKPDGKLLKYNQELLQSDLTDTITVSPTIDKRENEGMRRKCAYCGVDRKENGADLMRCPCKLCYFCSKECQTLFWPHHKRECKAARRKQSRSSVIR